MSWQLLIIDDDELTLEVFVEAFTARGFDVLVAHHGQEALDLVTETNRRPHAIILDLDMPVMDGLDFLRKRGTVPQLAGVPVVLTSAVSSQLTQTDLVFAVVPKPCSIDQLAETVELACVVQTNR